jgi:membrane-bound lytic murein transglycosylase D
MRIFQRSAFLAVVPLLALGLVSCDTGEKRQHNAAVPTAVALAPVLTAPAAPPAPPQPVKQEPKPTPPPADPVQDLIEAVEKEFQAGQDNYAAGHLDAAKQNFDRAFNMLLSGPVNVHADPRLEQELDKLTDQVHSLELAALKQGDGFSEQKLTPAPIEEANDLTFPVDPRIKAQAEAEIKNTHSDLPLVMNDLVASYINFYSTRGHGTVERALARAGRYRQMIQRVFKEEGVPQDLIYLAQAESGFQPLAISRASARGMWQFMASRASAYGLQRNWWVDERQDPEKSTRAAARHLKDLYNEFGDWYLAMAAYNSGPGTVQAGVQRTGYADFWQLYRRNVLPKETKNYVPIILALTIISKNPGQYGLEGISAEPPVATDEVKIDYPVDLRLVAECTDTTVAVLQDLNPALLRMTTPREGAYELRLPAGTKDKYQTNIAAIPVNMRTWWRYHHVAPGDTLAEVARRYHTTTKAIAQVNNLPQGDDELVADSKIIIPVTPGREDDGQIKYSKGVVRYRVRQHDTVLSVADEWGVTPEALRKWNRLKGNQLTRGRVLSIHRPLDSRNQAAAGDSSSTRSNKHKKHTSTASAKTSSTEPQSGATPANTSKSFASNKVQSAAARRVTHKVRSGETLYSIARRYNTTVAALERQNGVHAANLKAGDVLVIASR